jgi:dCMP deaminase
MSYQKDNQKEAKEDLAAQDLAKQRRLDRVFMNIAKEVATLSHCQRSKVGAVIELYGNIVSFGFNGAPKGMPNCCEDENNVTLPYIIHAESNSIIKAAKSGQSMRGGTLYLTLSPCLDCCKLILQSEIKRVVYLEEYRDRTGIDFLRKFIKVEKYEQSNI